jgi:hypothetical protein
MNSKVADAIHLTNQPVALVWSDQAPEDAMTLKPGRWACVMAMFAAAATKSKVSAFTRETYGCWGAGSAFGFGNRYVDFPGGVECFNGFLGDGNENTEKGRQVGQTVASWGNRKLADDFTLGERYLRDSATTQRWIDSTPFCDIPTKFVLLKPLSLVDPEKDDVKCVTFFVDTDRLSALVVLANHGTPERENIAMPFGAGCQMIGIFAYAELKREHPRALIGLTDISARNTVRAALGREALSFTAPWPVYQRMEASVDSSFLHRESWHTLMKSGTAAE